MPRFRDIPRLTPEGDCKAQVPWTFIERVLADFEAENGLDLYPDFHRGDVWTEEQQIKYVEHVLQGGRNSREIKFNCRDSRRGDTHPYVIVDGLQRLTAVRRFLANEIPAFGHYYRDYDDKLDRDLHAFEVCINSLPTKAAEVKWYLELNVGGTAHSSEDIAKANLVWAVAEGRPMDAFDIYEPDDCGLYLASPAKIKPGIDVRIFYDSWPNPEKDGYYWARRDLLRPRGPFATVEDAREDFERNYDAMPEDDPERNPENDHRRPAGP